MTESELLEAKGLLVPLLEEIKGVSGVGVGDGCINVYLEAEDPEARRMFEQRAQERVPQMPLCFVVARPFRPLSSG